MPVWELPVVLTLWSRRNQFNMIRDYFNLHPVKLAKNENLSNSKGRSDQNQWTDSVDLYMTI